MTAGTCYVCMVAPEQSTVGSLLFGFADMTVSIPPRNAGDPGTNSQGGACCTAQSTAASCKLPLKH